LRKSPLIFLDYFGCKYTHFSQMSQTFFDFSSFSKNNQTSILLLFSQHAQNEALTKISFFANDYTFLVVSICQRTHS
jgi:hypothetical protein